MVLDDSEDRKTEQTTAQERAERAERDNNFLFTDGGDPEEDDIEITEEGPEAGDVTRDNIDERQGPLQEGKNLNQAAVGAMESGVNKDEDAVETVYDVVKQEGEEIYERQEDFDQRIEEEIDHTEDIKTSVEETGTLPDDDRDLVADAQYNEAFVEDFTTPGSGSEPVPLTDGVNSIETDAMRWGTFGGDFVMFKGLFDTHKQETGEENRSAAQSAGKYGGLANKHSNYFEDHVGFLKEDVDTLRDELHLTERDSGVGDLSAVENLEQRIAVYEDVKETADTNIERYNEAKVDSDPSVPERASSTIREVFRVAEEEEEDMLAEFDPSERHAAKKAWGMTTVAAADSMNDMWEEVQERRDIYADARDEVREERAEWLSMKRDVEDLTRVDQVDETTAEALRELDVNTVIDLGTMDDGAELEAKIDDSPYGVTGVDEDALQYIGGRADALVENAAEEVFGAAEEEGLITEYGFDDLDDKVESNLNSTGEVSNDAIGVEQLEGAYRKSEDVIQVLSDLEESFNEEINSYDTAIEEVEDEYGLDDLGSYVEEEHSDAYDTVNAMLAEDDQIEA